MRSIWYWSFVYAFVDRRQLIIGQQFQIGKILFGAIKVFCVEYVVNCDPRVMETRCTSSQFFGNYGCLEI